MDKARTLNLIREVGLLAVLRGPTPDLTLKMVDALVEGGVTGIEITYSTPDAPSVVRTLKDRYGDRIVLGMGTLTKPEQAEEAKAAGALFVVSPHCKPPVAEAMVRTGLASMVGALTPTEVEQAHSLGADVVKIFPASLVGPAYLRSLRGPFPHIPVMPSGGVRPDILADWFEAGAFAVSAGSELCPPDWAEAGRFADITARARQFIEALRQARTGIGR